MGSLGALGTHGKSQRIHGRNHELKMISIYVGKTFNSENNKIDKSYNIMCLFCLGQMGIYVVISTTNISTFV